MSRIKRVRKDFPALIMEFNKKYGSPRQPHIAVVEGGDEPYYRPRISSNLLSGSLEFLEADGRNNVVEISKCVLSDSDTYDEKRFLFFIDRDYAIPAHYESYITPRHSLENFYASEEGFRNVVRAGFKLDPEGEDLQLICQLYASWYRDLCTALLNFNSWLIFQTTEARDRNGKSPSLNLNSVGLSKVVKVNFVERRISFNVLFDLNDPLKLFPGGFQFDQSRVDEIRDTLLRTDPFLYFRGKFALDFMVMVLNYLREDSNRETPAIFGSKRKFHLPFGGNLVSEFAAYAETPICLVRYLRSEISA